MSYTPVDLVEVHAFGERVGAVGADPTSGQLVFNYTPEWRRRGIELAPLTMPTSAPGPFSFPRLSEETFRGLPPLLADSLPDAFGNRLIDAWMADQGLARTQITALDRLAYLADRGVGALEFRPPADLDTTPPTAIQLADLVVAARSSVAGEFDTDDALAADALRTLISVGTSAGGARAKAVLAYNPDTGQIRSGQLDAPDGFTHWLIKLDGVSDDSREFGTSAGFGRIEYAYHLMALDAGLHMSECRLLEEHDRAHFMTRRFDRPAGGGKRHLLSLCGIAHLDFNMKAAHSYSQYLEVVQQLELGPDALEEAFRRIVFNVVAVNRDDHTKNLAFVMDPDGTWHLSPAFDVMFAYNPTGVWTATHQMTLAGKLEHITRVDLEQLADRFAVPGARHVIDQTVDAVSRWAEHAEAAGVTADWVEHIGGLHRQLGLKAG